MGGKKESGPGVCVRGRVCLIPWAWLVPSDVMGLGEKSDLALGSEDGGR